MFLPEVRRRTFIALALGLLLALALPAAALASSSAELRRSLSAAMRSAGPASGAHVYDAGARKVLFDHRGTTARTLASNTKLFTTATALEELGPEETFSTEVLGAGGLDAAGTWRGNLVLRGDGDPTFGSSAFARRHYAAAGGVEALAATLEQAGIRAVSGRVIGDESLFDARRGGPGSGWGPSIYVGPLSALSFNRGLANEGGFGFQRTPPLFAAGRLDAALAGRGIDVRGAPGAGVAPPEAQPLAAVASPPLGRLVQITNKRSDNFFAEMLLKAVAARAATPPGTTAAGAARAVAFARRAGVRARLTDGSGLHRGNRASPRSVVRLIDRVRSGAHASAFSRSLPIAGRDGTLSTRMRSGPARRRCRAKTGTLSNVSTLSGYCTTTGRDTVVFSLLMNGVNTAAARRLQDRMTQAIAGYDADDAAPPPADAAPPPAGGGVTPARRAAPGGPPRR